MGSEFRIGRDFPAEYQWSRGRLGPIPLHADASRPRARYRLASASSENTCAPFLAMPRAHLAIAEPALHDTEHVLHFGAHFAKAAIARLLSLAELTPRFRLLLDRP